MRRNGIAYIVFLGSAALCVGQALLFAPALPERMAAHFDAAGVPNGWMPRSLFIKVNLGIVGLLAVALLAVSFKLRSAEASTIKLPDKDYWMAPERRQATVDFLAGYFLWFGAATLLLMFDVFRQVFRFNLSASPVLAHPLSSLTVYVSFVAMWVFGFYRRFAKNRPLPPP